MWAEIAQHRHNPNDDNDDDNRSNNNNRTTRKNKQQFEKEKNDLEMDTDAHTPHQMWPALANISATIIITVTNTDDKFYYSLSYNTIAATLLVDD